MNDARFQLEILAKFVQTALAARGWFHQLAWRNGFPSGTAVFTRGKVSIELHLHPLTGKLDVTYRGLRVRPAGVGYELNPHDPGIANRIASVVTKEQTVWDAAPGNRLEARSNRPY
jgi:hypothetical protein